MRGFEDLEDHKHACPIHNTYDTDAAGNVWQLQIS